MLPQSESEYSQDEEPVEQNQVIPAAPKASKPSKIKVNIERPLLLGKKGIASELRFFMQDLFKVIPNAAKDKKFCGSSYVLLNDIADTKNCNTVILLETRHSNEYYMWISMAPGGPTLCSFIENMHTIEEYHFIGSCHSNSRPLIFFDPQFESSTVLKIAKKLLHKSFGFRDPESISSNIVDTAISFLIADNHIWFSRYQIIWEGSSPNLLEAGPRFCLFPVLVLSGSFCGRQIYKNNDFVAPHKRKKNEAKKL